MMKTKMPHVRKDQAEMPSVSYGPCRIKACEMVEWLANGLCVTHWDKGLDLAMDKKRRRRVK